MTSWNSANIGSGNDVLLNADKGSAFNKTSFFLYIWPNTVAFFIATVVSFLQYVILNIM